MGCQPVLHVAQSTAYHCSHSRTQTKNKKVTIWWTFMCLHAWSLELEREKKYDFWKGV
jgi:hypothetical protein